MPFIDHATGEYHGVHADIQSTVANVVSLFGVYGHAYRTDDNATGVYGEANSSGQNAGGGALSIGGHFKGAGTFVGVTDNLSYGVYSEALGTARNIGGYFDAQTGTK